MRQVCAFKPLHAFCAAFLAIYPCASTRGTAGNRERTPLAESSNAPCRDPPSGGVSGQHCRSRIPTRRRAGCGRGVPAGDADIESFNGRLREECLNVHGFEDLTDTRAKLQVWQQGTMRSGLTGLSTTSHPCSIRRRGINRDQKIANPVD